MLIVLLVVELVRQVLRIDQAGLDEADQEGPRAGEGIEDLHARARERLPEMLA